MWRGLYTAATGMITETRRTDVISNNIANADTVGYKRDVAIHHEFENMFIRRVRDFEDGGVATGFDVGGPPALADLNMNSKDVTQIRRFNATSDAVQGIGELGLGDYIEEVRYDANQGALETTGNTFDLGIVGSGYFVVDTPDGVRYTRNGSFIKNSEGVLQNLQGYNLLDTEGEPIIIPPNVTSDRVFISASGDVNISDGVNDRPRRLAQIQLVQFEDVLSLRKQGDNLYYAVTDEEGNTAEPQPATGEIIQGALEMSNAEIVKEMVELIHNQRMYEAGAKAVTTQDSMLDNSVNQVGRVGG